MPETLNLAETQSDRPAFASLAFAKAGRNLLNPEKADQLAAELFKRRRSLMEGPRLAQLEASLITTVRMAEVSGDEREAWVKGRGLGAEIIDAQKKPLQEWLDYAALNHHLKSPRVGGRR